MRQDLQYEIQQVMPQCLETGLFVSRCTVQKATNATDTLGQVDYTASGFANIAGVVNVRCMRAPTSMLRISATQLDTPMMMDAFNVFHVLLDDYYPQIPEAVSPGRSELRAIIDGVAHEILGVESSSQGADGNQTRLMVRQVGV